MSKINIRTRGGGSHLIIPATVRQRCRRSRFKASSEKKLGRLSCQNNNNNNNKKNPGYGGTHLSFQQPEA
jgi:hypothetical protein